MFIDLDAITEGEWFPFRMSTINPDTGETIWGEESSEAKVKIRSWKKFFEDLFANRERIVEWKVHPKSKANQKHENLKELTPEETIRQKIDAVDYAILEWEGFKDKKSKKIIKCTKDTKNAMMGLDFFDRFFTECQVTIDSKKIESEKAQEKNL